MPGECSDRARASGATPRKWRRRLLVVGFSLGVGFVIGEIAVRIVVGSPLASRLPLETVRANPMRGWEMVPGVHYTYHHSANINSHGLRGPEIGPKGDALRVLALGDSLTYGQGVGDEETISHFLGVGLNALDPARSWQSINGGHRAYGTAQELGLLEELGPELEPDVVVLFWYWNDLYEDPVDAIYARLEPLGTIAFDTKRPMEGWAKFEWHAIELLRKSALLMLLQDTIGTGGAGFTAPGSWGPGLKELGKDELPRFIDLCDELGARPIVAFIPDPKTLKGPHVSAEVLENAKERALRRKLPVVDLTDTLREVYAAEGQLPVIPFDGHYLPPANRAMGEAVARLVLETLDGESND